jgi:hypothetical protein
VKARELRVGDRVYVRTPYEGPRGWGRIESTELRDGVPTGKFRVKMEPGPMVQTPDRTLTIGARLITMKHESDEST